MASSFSQIRVADFFCGCGGTSAGLQLAGMDIKLGLDIEPQASKTFRANFPEATFIERDIAQVDPLDIRGDIGDDKTPLLVSACAPCQPYSSFVGRRPSDPRRALLLRLLPFIRTLRPEFVFVENVPGLKAARANAGTFSRFCKALREEGYHVTFEVVDCQHYGVPQRRRRLVILASLLAPVEVPEPTHGRGADQDLSTVWEWIGDLPKIKAGEIHPEVPNHHASAVTEINLRRLRATPPGGGRADWPSELRLECHKNHTGHSDVYGRMHADAPAPVLTTKCTSISNGRFGHPFQDRPISVREAACLQTFPRDFVFSGSIKSSTRQVGNAVPVLLAQRMGEAFVAQHESRLMEQAADGLLGKAA
jgi:DNA (cytosine-5)-methyltransferase 1